MQAHATQTALRLIDMIGTGSTGTVFRAERTVDGQRTLAAVKVPHHHTSLQREADALKRFVHPNIVALLDDRTSHDGSLVLELCELGTVEDLLHERVMAPSEVASMVRQISSALNIIHDSGFIHGDINPSNIGIRSDNVAVLLDFGTARKADGSSPIALTEAFSGNAISTMPLLDVRALAATALGALGSPTADNQSVGSDDEQSVDDQRRSSLAAGLTECISHCDLGIEVTLAELDHLFNESPSHAPPMTSPLAETVMAYLPKPDRDAPNHDELITSPQPTRRPSQGGPGGPGGPRTRNFGPGRDSSDSAPASTPTSNRAPSGVLVTVALLFICVFVSATFLGIGAISGSDVLPHPDTAVEQLTAQDTIVAANAEWNASNGSVRIHRGDTPITFAAGQAGDHGAIADWNCNGVATLGVFRPTTGTWFTFSDWTPNALSVAEVLGEPGSTSDEVLIEIDESGCARPVVSQANS